MICPGDLKSHNTSISASSILEDDPLLSTISLLGLTISNVGSPPTISHWYTSSPDHRALKKPLLNIEGIESSFL